MRFESAHFESVCSGLCRSAASRALTGKPCSASFTAGAMTSAHFRVPNFSSACASPATEPGTPTAR
jgi:hypothetical protein